MISLANNEIAAYADTLVEGGGNDSRDYLSPEIAQLQALKDLGVAE